MSRNQTIENTIPILPVRDIPQSIAFYTSTLGFTLDWGGQPDSTICSVSRDGHSLMLARDFGCESPAWVWIGLEDDSLFDELRAKGVTVIQEPRNFAWAYEMKFADPDGNVLWLGTEPRSDLPLEDRA